MSEMKKLNRMQHYGLIAFFGGIGMQLAVALWRPSWGFLTMACWAIGALGAIIYVWGTLPSVVEWLKRLGKPGT